MWLTYYCKTKTNNISVIKRQYKFEYSALMTFFIKVNVNRKLIYDIYILFKSRIIFYFNQKKNKVNKEYNL